MKVELYIIQRVYLPTETLGSWYDNGNLICKTLELPWHGNKRNISCIPEGIYFVTKENPIPEDDPRHYRPYEHFRVHDVPDRSGILIHPITYVRDLLGCTGVGSRFLDIDKDGIPDMAESKIKLQWMVENLPSEFYLKYTKK